MVERAIPSTEDHKRPIPMFVFETWDPHIPSHSVTAPALINAMMAGSYTPHRRFCPELQADPDPTAKSIKDEPRETDSHSPVPFTQGGNRPIGAGSALKSTRLPPCEQLVSSIEFSRAPPPWQWRCFYCRGVMGIHGRQQCGSDHICIHVRMHSLSPVRGGRDGLCLINISENSCIVLVDSRTPFIRCCYCVARS
jgi:hypothetical protein